jgi:hypothetical protein
MFLLALVAGAAAGGGYLAGRHRVFAAGAVTDPWPQWLLDSNNREAVVRLGNAYRSAHPAEADAAVLLDAIDRALAAAGAGAAATPPAVLASAMQQRVRDEYTRGEVVRVTGWILSVTEARLYALVALGPDAPAGR